ncbi:MAG: helix-turn-helix domain-containing protein [Clostridia bacterium]|nr:helix-turn-helix domain-containing protein [Clostridia bacterium]
MIYLAENIRAFRKKRGLTQEEVAEAVFVSPQSVSKWERGETVPDIELLPALAMLFETSIDSLMGMERIHADEAHNDVFRRAHIHYENGDYAQAAAVHREGLKRFPNDDGMLSELALSLAMLPGGLAEAIEICERMLARDGSEKIRHTVRAALCLMYGMNGEMERAEKLARTLPHVRESREEILAALERGGVPGENERCMRFLTLGKA